MAEKILIASGKGGVGKSTVASFLGMQAAKNGKKVLLIDADTGLGALDILLGVSDRTMHTWLDVAAGNCDVKNAVINVSEGLFVLPSPSYCPDDLASDTMFTVTEKCGSEFDFILIDASAGIDANLKMCACACDRAIFVATADEVSVKCAAAAARETEKYGIDRDDMRLVINRYIKKAAMRSRLLNVDGVIDKSGVMLLGILPEDKKIPYMSVTSRIPDGKSSFLKAIKRIVRRINGENIPLSLKI